jgi:putative membrane protein
MSIRTHLTRAATYGALAALSLVAVAPGAVAQSGTVSSLSQRQSVSAALSPDGEVETSRLYTQILAQGDGPVQLTVPTATTGLRNLEGFGRPAIGAGAAVWDLDLRPGAPQARRTVATYDGDLPVTVEARYLLDGQPVEPADVVGRSGLLTATYRITNVTAAPTEIEFRDGQGRRQTETVDVTVPLAGTFTTTLDERFGALDAPTAIQAGDGRGNTVLSWSLLLFEPVGSNEVELSWSANVTDAVIPAASAQVVPVVAESSPLDNAAGELGRLLGGAVKIDQSVVRLSVGAGQLLDGITRLADGAGALRDGLGSAASGSGELAEGMGKANDGGGKLAAGLGELAAGAGTLSDGLSKARAGGGPGRRGTRSRSGRRSRS